MHRPPRTDNTAAIVRKYEAQLKRRLRLDILVLVLGILIGIVLATMAGIAPVSFDAAVMP